MDEIISMMWTLLKIVFKLFYGTLVILFKIVRAIIKWILNLAQSKTKKAQELDLLKQQLPPMNWNMFTPLPVPTEQRDVDALIKEIENAPPGSVVRLQAGLYKFDKPLQITKSLTLEGEGMDKTRISYIGSENKGYFIQVVSTDDNIHVTIRNICFEYMGDVKDDDLAYIIWGFNSTLEIQRCAFTSAKGINNVVGLGILANTKGIVRDCKFYDIDTGVFVDMIAEAAIEDNIFWNNKMGIVFTGNSKGKVSKNTFIKNMEVGIGIYEEAEVVLENNRCWQNGEVGIYFGKNAKGEARKNECVENGYAGIALTEQSCPLIEDNICLSNGEFGIIYEHTANPIIKNNRCSGNAKAEISKY